MRNIYLSVLIGLAILVFSIGIGIYKKPNLGLDLKGGIEMVMEPDFNLALKQEYDVVSSDLNKELIKNKINILDVESSQDGIKIDLLDKNDKNKVISIVNEYFKNLQLDKKSTDTTLYYKFSNDYISSFRDNIVSQTIDVLRRRVDQLGVVQPIITRLGTDRILIELPGVMDLERAKKVIGKTAQLELMLVYDSSPNKEVLEKELKPNEIILPSKNGDFYYLLDKTPVITGKDLKTATEGTDSFNNPAVDFELNSEGAKKFGEFTASHIGKQIAIVLDNKVMSAPVVRSRISSNGQITGNFTPEQVKDLAAILRAGALPTSLKILEDSVVGPTLGKASIHQGIEAGLTSFLFVVFLMILRYKTAGITASIAIVMNGLLLWALLVLLGATLTLPGIAGIILNMGIAVDSNVLIFERIKEELSKGNTIKKAIELGYKRVLSAIYDTHATLLVAAIILFQFSSGPVKGFATTLTLGTIASFISNVYYSKSMLDILAKLRIFKV